MEPNLLWTPAIRCQFVPLCSWLSNCYVYLFEWVLTAWRQHAYYFNYYVRFTSTLVFLQTVQSQFAYGRPPSGSLQGQICLISAIGLHQVPSEHSLYSSKNVLLSQSLCLGAYRSVHRNRLSFLFFFAVGRVLLAFLSCCSYTWFQLQCFSLLLLYFGQAFGFFRDYSEGTIRIAWPSHPSVWVSVLT